MFLLLLRCTPRNKTYAAIQSFHLSTGLSTYDAVPGNSDFVVGKHEYLPFPRDVKTSNKYLKDVLGWESENAPEPAE